MSVLYFPARRLRGESSSSPRATSFTPFVVMLAGVLGASHLGVVCGALARTAGHCHRGSQHQRRRQRLFCQPGVHPGHDLAGGGHPRTFQGGSSHYLVDMVVLAIVSTGFFATPPASSWSSGGSSTSASTWVSPWSWRLERPQYAAVLTKQLQEGATALGESSYASTKTTPRAATPKLRE